MTGCGFATRDLWYGYEGGTHNAVALEGISIRVESGEFVAVVGQNGSGKSTLAKHFNGLLRATRGEVQVDGHAVGARPVHELARRVGYVFQNPDHQIFCPTVREEIATGPRNLGLDDSEVADRVSETLASFDLEALAERQPATLSFGLRRKVAVAAVFAIRTPVLILDEPTGGLDALHTARLMARVHDRHCAGHTVVLITHDMRIVAEHAPRCLVLGAGQVLAYDDTRAVFERSDVLIESRLEAPQITRLAGRMVHTGMPATVLDVPEFCAAYASLYRRSQTVNRED